MKLLLDMYKGVSKDQRDKVQLMAAEKKLRAELEEAKQALKKIQVRHFIIFFTYFIFIIFIYFIDIFNYFRRASVKNARN